MQENNNKIMNEKDAIVKLCVVAIVYKDDKFLFLKRLSPSKYWCPPCGGVRFKEKITDALHREVFEEAGIKVKIIKIVDAWQGIHENQEVFSLSYLCEAQEDKITISDEHQDYKWVNIADLTKINTDFDVSKWSEYLCQK